MIKALVTVPGAELAATSDLSEPAQQVEWASGRSGASGPEGYIFRTLERPSHCLVFVTEASLMELVAPSRGRGLKIQASRPSKAYSTVSLLSICG